MKASLRVGGVEIALSAPRGPLEDCVLDTFGPWLGVIATPRAWVAFDRAARTTRPPAGTPVARLEEGTLHLRHPSFRGAVRPGGQGTFTVAARPGAVRLCAEYLFAALLPGVALLVDAAAAVSVGRAHVFLTPDAPGVDGLLRRGARPRVGARRVALCRSDDEWLVASTPFEPWTGALPATAPMAALWLADATTVDSALPLAGVVGAQAVLERALLPCPDRDLQRRVFDLAADVVGAVPVARLPETPTWDELDARATAFGVREALLAWDEPAVRARLIRHALVQPGRRGRR